MGDNDGRTRGEDGNGSVERGGGAKGGAFAAGDDDDDERSDRPSPMFPLLSPPRAEPGNVGAAAGGGGGGRLSPSVGLTPSTVQLGLLNSATPSMHLGPGAGAWLGATGGVGGGTGGFGMSAAVSSFVQTSQLAPFLLSQMGPHGSFGVGTSSMFGRATQGAPAASGPVGQGQEKNFCWLERFYAAHRSSAGLSSASGDAAPRASTASAGLSHGGGGGFGSKFGVRHDRGGGGDAVGGGAPSHGHGHSSIGSAVMHRGDGAAGGSVGGGGGAGLRGGGTEGGREGAGHVEEDGEGFAMEMTSQQQQQQQQQQRQQQQQQQQQQGPDGLP